MTVPVAAKFTTKRHSRRPYLRLLAKDKDGNPFDLTGATGAKFMMYNDEGVQKFYSDAILENPVGGILRYEWEGTDLDTAGEFTAEFDIQYSDGVPMTLPLNGVILVTVYEDLNNA